MARGNLSRIIVFLLLATLKGIVFSQSSDLSSDINLRTVNLIGYEWHVANISDPQKEYPELLFFNHYRSRILSYNDSNINSAFIKRSSAPNYIGYARQNDTVLTFYASKNYNSFYFLDHSSVNKENQFGELNLEFKKEKFLGSFMEEGNCFLVSIKRRSSIIVVYTIPANLHIQRREYDFSSVQFKNNGYNVHLHSLIQSGVHGISKNLKTQVSFIHDEELMSLKETTNSIKFFHYSDQLFLTVNNSHEKTQVLIMVLNSVKCEAKEFHFTTLKGYYQMTNSVLYQNYFFQAIMSDDALNLQIFDLDTKRLKKEFNITKENFGEIRNSNYHITSSSEFGKDQLKELEDDVVIFRKLSNWPLAIACKKFDNVLEIRLGNYSGYTTDFDVGNPFNSVLGFDLKFESKRESYFKIYLDNNTLKHIPDIEERPPNVLEKANSLVNSFSNSESVIRHLDQLYHGFYDKQNGKYILEAVN